jgi:DNA-binding CsgD family transcriptional regulator
LLIPASINQLIQSIYQGVMEEPPWNSFINQLNELLEADIAVVMLVPANQQGNKVLFNQVVDKQSEEADTSLQWLAFDPFQNIQPDKPIRLNELTEQQSIGQNSEYQQQLTNSTSRHHMIALDVITEGNPELILKLRVARSLNKENFNEQQCLVLSGIVSHIKLALHYFDHMAIQRIERNAFADAINQFMLGTLILDSNGTIVASNRVARDCIEHQQLLSMNNGCLVITDKNSNRQLYQALEAIEQSDNSDDVIGQTITIGQSNDLSLGLIIRPIRPEDALAYPVHAHAVVFISNSQGTRKISAATLKELFGFTDSESKVAAYLANGHTLTEAAEALSVSINTAKTHAKNIYEKTGVNKQTKFIQLVSNSVARVS